jgi:hypothetical protein
MQRESLKWRGAYAITVAWIFLLSAAAIGSAQTGTGMPKTLPETSIAPAGDSAPDTAPEGDTEGPDITAPTGPEGGTIPPAGIPHSHPMIPAGVHTHPMISAPYHGPIEPGTARLQVKTDDWAYARPDKSSNHIEQLEPGKFVDVTGATHYFLQVKLKSGQTAYVPMDSVELARPADKIFRLTKDTPVLSVPSHLGTKLAEVHNGHDVHVVGMSMNYMKIRMKDGLEGYVSVSALE